MNKWIIVAVLVLLMLGLCAASILALLLGFRMITGVVNVPIISGASVTLDEIDEKELTVDGPVTLSVENDFGGIEVVVGDDDRVIVKSEKTAWGVDEEAAQANMDAMKIIVTQSGNAIDVSIERPKTNPSFSLGSNGSSVKFTVTVPADTAAELTSDNGDISLSGIIGGAQIKDDFGNITLKSVNGKITAETNNGGITASDIGSGQDVSLASEYGSLTVSDVEAADLRLNTENGTIDLRDFAASGSLTVSSDFGSVRVEQGQSASADISSSNGALTLEKLTADGQLVVESDFGALDLTDVEAGSYDLSTNNGRIRVDGASGPIMAQSDFGDIEVLNAEEANLNLSSNNGQITFTGSLGAGPHLLKSDFGNISLTLPADTALDMDLKTGFGKITSDFAITISGEIDEKHWQGVVNGGGDSLTAETNNGNITVTKK